MATQSNPRASRGHARGIITKLINESVKLMTNENNVALVKERLLQIKNAFRSFEVKHKDFHTQLKDENSILDSTLYFEEVVKMVSEIDEEINAWLQGNDASNLDMRDSICPEDSVSNAGSQRSTQSSIKSLRSTLSAAKAKATAKMAMLQAEAKGMEKLYQLQQEELKLQQSKKLLILETEMAKAKAEERAYLEAEDQEAVKEEHDMMYSNSPQLIQDSKDSHSVNDQPERVLTLNAEAPAWNPIKSCASDDKEDSFRQILQQQQQAIMALTLPQPDVPIFKGDPIEYCDFMRAFENLIERRTQSESQRLFYLLQYTSGQVQDLVRSCLVMSEEEGYKRARQLLAERYGQSYKIATAYIDRLTSGPSIRADDSISLQRFSILLTSCMNTLKEIGYLSRLENPEALKGVVNRLPYGLKVRWRDLVDNIYVRERRDPALQDLVAFVEANSRAACHPIFGKITSDNRSENRLQSRPQRVKTFSTEASTTIQRSPECHCCNANHWLSRCEKFKGMKVEERLKLVKAKNLCMNCLFTGHHARECKKDSFCRINGCRGKHSTFLHQVKSDKESKPANDSARSSQRSIEEGSTSSLNSSSNGYVDISQASQRIISLPIVPVRVKGPDGNKEVQTYAFLDSGSNTTFCTDNLLKKLNIEGKATQFSLTTLGKHNQLTNGKQASLQVLHLNQNTKINLPNVISRPSLPASMHNAANQSDIKEWVHLHKLDIPKIDSEIELLIGNDVPEALEPQEVIRCEGYGPYAVRTALGWTINGPLNKRGSTTINANFIQTEDLSRQFRDYCNLDFNDSTYDPNPSMSRNDIRALDIMKNSVKHVSGHYELSLPWKDNIPSLKSNKLQAENRLQLLKKRLSKQPDLHAKYNGFIKDLLNKNYAKKVSDEDLTRADAWYLPHHPVFHPKKPGKVRVVFDCSAKYNGRSLNEELLQGPDLTNSLVGVLTRFREKKIAIMSDIEAMFYQVRVNPEDRNYLRFLWWPNGDLEEQPVDYQMLVHLFGGASSPSCANFALKRTAEDNKHLFDKETIDTVNRNFYVDDCLRSVVNVPQALRLVEQLRELLARGGFHLTKWISNSQQVIDAIPESERSASIKNLDLDDTSLCERALGVHWNIQNDTFGYKIIKKDRPVTRRGILSIVSSIYDPLGFVSPYILTAKAILQDLCQQGLGWDEDVPGNSKNKWLAWLSDLPKLEQFYIPRCFKEAKLDIITRCELHHFSDANVKRYGVLFTCLSIRAIHIEIANSLDSDSFINSLRRFIARRGKPREIISDNGGNFVKGNKELKSSISQWNQAQINDHLSQNNIKWTFNPPAASHHGGVWERCIRTVRKVLSALMHQQVLDDEALITLMCEVESIINGRPLTKLSDDPRDSEPLTPNHLLLLRSSNIFPPGLFVKQDVYSRRRWRQVQYLADIFWKRWLREYLPSLQERQKWNKICRNVAVNDIVLLIDENLPRSSWPLARVLEVFRNNKDDLVRSVRLRTSTSEFKRPIDKIVLLEEALVEKDKENQQK